LNNKLATKAQILGDYLRIVKLAPHKRTISGKLKTLRLSQMASTLGGSAAGKHAEHFYKDEIIVSSLEDFQKILNSVELDMTEFTDDMSYSGFDKNKIALLAAKNLGAKRTVKLCLLGGMRGTNLKKILERSRKVDSDISSLWRSGKILANGTGPEDLTMGRLMATFPEHTAHYMLKYDVPKKLPDDLCHAALQYPAAAGLPMNHTTRMLHLEFSIRFSFLISRDKKFYPQYYRAAFNGQQPMKALSDSVQKLVGNPTDSESKQFDFDAAMNGFIGKYGKDRFVVNSGAMSGQPDLINIPK
jgi:hypothetical protein